MHRRHLVSWWLAAALVLASLVAVQPSSAQNPADIAAARELFQQGAKASKEKRWEEAINLFVRSLALKPAPLTMYTLAVAQRETGRLAEALENFRAFLSAARDPSAAPFERPAREAVAELEKRVAQLLVQIEPPAVEKTTLYIDGAPVPEAALGLRRLVNPGSHVVRVAAPGYADASKEITLEPGESADVGLTLVPSTPPSDDAAPGPNAGPTDRSADTPLTANATEGPSLVLPITLLASGAVMVGVGLAVGLTAVDDAADAPSSDGSDAEAARGQASAGDLLTGLGIGLAGAGLVWLIVELVTDDSGAPAGSTAFVHPYARRGASGLAFTF